MNNSAQIHVFEVIFVVLMFIMALFFVKSIEVSTHATIEKENELEKVGESILAGLAGQAAQYEEYSSLLAYYIDPNDSSNANELRNLVDAVIPESILYKILRVNISKIMCNSNVTIENCTDVLYEPLIWIGEDARVSRIVVLRGFVYEVVLCMWINLRG